MSNQKRKKLSPARMTQNDVVTASDAVQACQTLSTFLRPMLHESRQEADLGAVQYFSGMMADLAALQQSLTDMMVEDGLLPISKENKNEKLQEVADLEIVFDNIFAGMMPQ